MEDLKNYLDLIVKFIIIIGAGVGYFQYMEVRKKRYIDMYWRISEIYSSDEQRNARNSIYTIETSFIKHNEALGKSSKEIAELYNIEYHLTQDEAKKKTDKSIMNRLRFLNQIGVLLNRKLIDRDLLFGLIGVGLELDYKTMMIVLKAHRDEHDLQQMYNEIETTNIEYNKWKITKKEAAILET